MIYFKDDYCTLYLGDCRAILPTLKAGSVDLVLTDPPYGIAYQNKRHDIRPRVYADVIRGDDSQDIGQEVIDSCFASGWPVCAFAHHRYPWRGEWRQWLVWDKGGAVGGGGDRETCWKFTWELVQVSAAGNLNGQRDEAVLRFHIGQASLHDHPTQKPLRLLAYLIGKLSDQGETILDPFAGSGTTLRAAKDLGRKSIGIEIEERYCEIAAKRLEQGVFNFDLKEDSKETGK